MEHGVWSAGTCMGLIQDIPSCKELVERIVREAEEMIRGRLCQVDRGLAGSGARPSSQRDSEAEQRRTAGRTLDRRTARRREHAVPAGALADQAFVFIDREGDRHQHQRVGEGRHQPELPARRRSKPGRHQQTSEPMAAAAASRLLKMHDRLQIEEGAGDRADQQGADDMAVDEGMDAPHRLRSA